ncbi:MAG: DUF3592 domain-containing protein [Bauldia sp.]
MIGRNALVLCGAWFVAAALVLFGGTLAWAQQEVPGSSVAGVIFPEPARVWFPDPQRSQAATLNALAAAAGLSCSTMEFHIWYPQTPAASDDLRGRTDVAFTEAGWALELVGTAAGGARDYVARRGGQELVMSWQVREGELGLLICLVGGPALPAAEGAGAAIALDEPRADDGTPLPRPRPDPNAPAPAPPPAPVVEQVPAVAVPAEPGPAVADAGAAPPAAAQPVPAAENPAAATADGGGTGGGGWSILLIVLAAILAGGAYFMFRWGFGRGGVHTWPTAIATIIYSQVASETKGEEGGKETVRYVPVVAYEYDVSGTPYRAARLRFADVSKMQFDEAKAITDRYPVGAGIEVHYNPAHPAEAVVELDGDRSDLYLIGGVALAVVSLASLISAVA